MSPRQTRYERALERVIADCEPEDEAETERIAAMFSDTVRAAELRLEDSFDAFVHDLRQTLPGRTLVWASCALTATIDVFRRYREFNRIASILRGLTEQDRKEIDMLQFQDYYAGSGRAEIDGGFYLVMPTAAPGVYRASRSNGKEWVWEGGSFDSPELAQAACQKHFDGGEG